MNQRIAVRALIRKNEKILLLRRANGRESILGKYELPGGRVEGSEQPEDALARLLKDAVGLVPQTIQLADVITYIDHDSSDVQYAVIIYNVSTISGKYDVNLSTKYDHYMWRNPTSVRQDSLTDLTQMLLNIHDQSISSVSVDEASAGLDDTVANGLIIYSDGGSRGNPGPSAAGYAILNTRGELIDEGGEFLGITTNNQAEYHGVRLGLERARELGVRSVEFRLDSLLVVNQLNGQYVIRNRELWPVHERIRSLMAQFDKVTFRHVKREFNQRADAAVNKILDEHAEEKV